MFPVSKKVTFVSEFSVERMTTAETRIEGAISAMRKTWADYAFVYTLKSRTPTDTDPSEGRLKISITLVDAEIGEERVKEALHDIEWVLEDVKVGRHPQLALFDKATGEVEDTAAREFLSEVAQDSAQG
jgi:hypothetical protein